MRFDRAVPTDALQHALITLPYVVLVKYVLMRVFEVHRHSWRYTSLPEVIVLTRTMAAAALLLGVVRGVAPSLTETISIAEYGIVPYSVILIDFVLSLTGLVAVRAARRLQTESREARTRSVPTRTRDVILVGAGRAGVIVGRELLQRPDLGIRPIGFVDDDPRKQGQTIQGLRVLGTTAALCDLAEEVDEAILTMASAAGEDIRRIKSICDDCGLDTKIIPGLYEIVGGHINISRIRPVAIEDLLRRDPVELDLTSIERFVTDETVMVTGAGGSIGAELCRQLARFDPARLVLLEQAETSLWAIHGELQREFPDLDMVPCIADVCDNRRVDRLIVAHAPSTVFHAAAHKHVPMMEWNPGEALKNNVAGTKTVVDLCASREVDRFVLISTDKAVNPTSVMGASKRVAERYVQHVAHRVGRPYMSVRFGNVLGSAGSVVPVFKAQIADGGPVTVTHPDMRRYFMTIPEATQLVLQTASMGLGGEIFVLDMGEPVRIVDLAEDLIRLSGFRPHEDVAIEFVGIRPGEKLYEELSLSQEDVDRTRHPKVFIACDPQPEWDTAELDLTDLLACADSSDEAEVRARLYRLVPEYVDSYEADDRDGLVLVDDPERSNAAQQ
ncbi:MAG: nucleoside-diphosphate sugar epimerase/dehydratase [Nitriliruptorales bacterium]|nr:nucleoside-diphosphate sugar epimerase/dehydratase [Nitriliruptorales bacterium]